MKKLLFLSPLAALVGCAEVQPVVDAAKDQLANPPEVVVESWKQLLTFFVEFAVNFLTGLFGPAINAIGSLLGL